MPQLAIMSFLSTCTASSLTDAAKSLIAGNLVAFPTETVYGLGADASNEKAVARIYEVKGRPTGHPLIVHISSINCLDKWARSIPDYALKLAGSFWPGPMTLILPRTCLAKDFITGCQDSVGIRVPANSVALSLLKEFENLGGLGVAAPSANRFGKVSPTSAKAVYEELDAYLSDLDCILDSGPCDVGIESTIIDCTTSMPRILRPGGLVSKVIEETIGITLSVETNQSYVNKIKVPGALDSHYSPNSKVVLTGSPQLGDGFIALESVKSPTGVVRLASPKTNTEYARCLYDALRLADKKGLKRVFVVPPTGDDISVAINDRLEKSSFSK